MKGGSRLEWHYLWVVARLKELAAAKRLCLPASDSICGPVAEVILWLQ